MGLYIGKNNIIAINEKVATKQWVTDLRYLTNSDLSDYVTIIELNTVSDMVDLVSAKVEDISTKISEKVATKQWVTDLRYLTDSNLADYATKTYVTEQIGSINSVLENI